MPGTTIGHSNDAVAGATGLNRALSSQQQATVEIWNTGVCLLPRRRWHSGRVDVVIVCTTAGDARRDAAVGEDPETKRGGRECWGGNGETGASTGHSVLYSSRMPVRAPVNVIQGSSSTSGKI